MANRREFLERSLILCGAAGFTSYTRAASLLFRSARRELLPKGWGFYESDGSVLFPLFGTSGAIQTSYGCWLIQHDGVQWLSIPVEFTWLEITATEDSESLKRLCSVKIKEAIKNTEPVPVNMNGGELPRVKK